MDPRAKAILDYWFGDLNLSPKYFKKRNKQWFMGGPKVDQYIRETFGMDLNAAVDLKLENWKTNPKEALALIILLDQFSLNLFREEPESYEQSEMFIPISKMM